MSKKRKYLKITHEEFLDLLKSSNKSFANGDFTIITQFETVSKYLVTRDKYGLCKSRGEHLLSGSVPTIESAIDKNDYYHNKLLDKNQYYKNNEFQIVGNYVNSTNYIEVSTKFGNCRVKSSSLLEDIKPSVQTAIDKHQYFINQLYSVNESFRNNEFQVINEFVSFTQNLIISTKYGLNSVRPDHLLDSVEVSILSALDKDEYFKNQLLEKNTQYKNGELELLDKYTSNKTKIKIKTSLGLFAISANGLLINSKTSFHNCLNKTEYFINLANIVHDFRYDYSLIDYKKRSEEAKVKIICEHHDIFEQRITDHLYGNGCPKCAKELNGWSYEIWIKRGLISRFFDSFKCYIIKCWNDDKSEVFYKIGKTFMTLKMRFNGGSLPYNYEVLNVVEGDGRYISELEINLLRSQKEFDYTPTEDFGGKTECFSNIDFNIINKIVNEGNNI